jgi:hypothetical protein
MIDHWTFTQSMCITGVNRCYYIVGLLSHVSFSNYRSNIYTVFYHVHASIYFLYKISQRPKFSGVAFSRFKK